MPFVLDPTVKVRRSVRAAATDGLDEAISLLDGILDGTTNGVDDIEHAVHEVRKRCKATRGVARLAEPALGKQFRPFDRLIRDAANQLSALRDAHALLATFDTLLAAQPGGADASLQSVREHHATRSADATSSIDLGDDRITIARMLLADARRRASRWKIGSGFDALSDGLGTTYRNGRSSLQQARRRPTDEALHEWRKAVKYLWYQTRLLHDAAPSALAPMVEQLDGLAEALGDDHDLAVLVALLDADPNQFGSEPAVTRAIELARAQQSVLRDAAFRAGRSIYVESPSAFTKRIAGYWNLAVSAGPEGPVGGIAALAEPAVEPVEAPVALIERERKFLIESVPDDIDLSNPIEIRQGYLVADERASVRVRDSGARGYRLTVKAGSGAERTELEWKLDRERFEAAWVHTEGRRLVKARHRIPYSPEPEDTSEGDQIVIELDIFEGDLTGLVYAEVEFTSTERLDAFEPPAWFGREVTDDGRYTNASLALHGRP